MVHSHGKLTPIQFTLEAHFKKAKLEQIIRTDIYIT